MAISSKINIDVDSAAFRAFQEKLDRAGERSETRAATCSSESGSGGEPPGPAHAKMHSQAVDHQRANPRLSYEAAYSRMYTHPDNAGLRAEINREHLGSSMAAVDGHGLGKAVAPPDPSRDYVSPGPAHDELNNLVMTRMKSDPKLSYQQSFTREYLLPANRSLKERVDSESILRMQRLEPAKPFPAYSRG